MSSGTPRTRSERLFGAYLNSVGITDAQFEPDLPLFRERGKVIDWVVPDDGGDVFFEVKEFSPEGNPAEIPEGGAVNPYPLLRSRASSGAAKFAAYKDQRCAIVLFNNGRWGAWLDSANAMIGALFGPLQLTVPVGPGVAPADREIESRTHGDALFWNHKDGKPRQAHVGAVVVLDEVALGHTDFMAAWAEAERVAGGEVEEATVGHLLAEHISRHPRVTVYENPYCPDEQRIPRSLFQGRFDGIWGGLEGGAYVEVLMGRDVHLVP